MAHVFEAAPTGRARCRGCGQALARGELRFGERVPNAFGSGEASLWFHPVCAAFKRPEPLLEALAAPPEGLAERETLERIARAQLAHPRLPRIDGAERAPSSQAKCRHCKEPIERGTWRIKLLYYEEGRPSPGGSVHVGCRAAYFECDDALAAVLRFSAGLDEAERQDLERACRAPAPT
ncbi:MAG: hypothetical protein ABIP29_04400 [Candidatus Eisenbacteria bacterium]